jgi:hypothetical protein
LTAGAEATAIPLLALRSDNGLEEATEATAEAAVAALLVPKPPRASMSMTDTVAEAFLPWLCELGVAVPLLANEILLLWLDRCLRYPERVEMTEASFEGDLCDIWALIGGEEPPDVLA